MLEILLEVIFDQESNLRIERLENLLDVLTEEKHNSNSSLFPIASAGVRLLFSNTGSELRRRLLMTLIKDDRLNTSDINALIKLIKRKFDLTNIAEGLLLHLNPLAA